MDFQALSPYVRVAMDSTIDVPWTLHERVIFDYELLYVKEGQVLITIEDSHYDAKPGDIFLFKPKIRHSITMKSPLFRQPHLHFDFYYRENSREVYTSFKPLDKIPESEHSLFRKDEIADLFPEYIPLQSTEHFEEMLFSIIRINEEKAPFFELESKAALTELIVYLLRETSLDGREKARIADMKKIGDYLKTQIQREVGLAELSAHFHLSRFHLLRSFKAVYGMTPVHFHRMIRLEKAKEKILYSNLSLTEIAFGAGYDSIQAFSRAFRALEGVPPSVYRG